MSEDTEDISKWTHQRLRYVNTLKTSVSEHIEDISKWTHW